MLKTNVYILENKKIYFNFQLKHSEAIPGTDVVIKKIFFFKTIVC